MPTTIYPVAGSRFYIGSAAVNLPDVDAVEADYAAVTWIEVNGYETAGSVGDAAQNIDTNLINRARTVTQKGTRKAPVRNDNFASITTDAGQLALIAAEKTNYNYPFRIDLNDAPVPKSSTVTITVASPGVVSWTAHGLAAGTPVVFTTTGALPTGLTAGTTYYVIAAGLATDSFRVSATPGGSAINTSGSQSGTHTAATQPVPSKRYFSGLVLAAEETGGGANTVRMLNCQIQPNTNTVRVAALG